MKPQLTGILFSLLAATGLAATNLPSVLPLPQKMVVGAGAFKLTPDTRICTDAASRATGEYLAAQLRQATGYKFKVTSNSQAGAVRGAILITTADAKAGLGTEGYELTVSEDSVVIRAPESAGGFYGVQTLLQLLPPEIVSTNAVKNFDWQMPCVKITDQPRFQWRGLLLDPARHFLSIDDLKRTIDQMAAYKYNILQLHLTDDQGWRLEIKSMPRLTEVGAWRVPRVGLWWHRKSPMEGESPTDGGFYTQAQMKDLIRYALDRHIQILPEIEMPGHSLAAIAAYPDLSSTKIQYKVNPGSVFYTKEDNTLCVGNEATFEYVEKVLAEVAALFPFEYIHIGGDECYKGFWKLCPDCQNRIKDNNLKDELGLQSYFIKRVEKILDAKGKRMIGWDEILEGGLAPQATVMSWRGTDGGIAAAKENHHVVMCPSASTYLDFAQGLTPGEPAGGGLLRLKTAYQFDPVPPGVDPLLVLGSLGNLWGEYVPTFRHAEYMLWPRSLALAEVFWTPNELKNWNDFSRRMEVELKKFDRKDINYSRCAYDAVICTSKDKDGQMLIELSAEVEDVDIYYSFDNTIPDQHSHLYKSGDKLSIPLSADNFRYVTYKHGVKVGKYLVYPLVPEI